MESHAETAESTPDIRDTSVNDIANARILDSSASGALRLGANACMV